MEICPTNVAKQIEIIREEKVQNDHKIDCLILLGYCILLILAVITIWIFKHKRLKFIHETAFSLIYGIILGIIFFYIPNNDNNVRSDVSMPQNPRQNCVNQLPPDNLILKLNVIDEDNKNSTLHFSYSYQQFLKGNTSDFKSLDKKATFNAEIFFNLLLPPIIFCAGYNMKKKHFFENLGAIITYAFFGTILSSFTIGGICYGLSHLVPNITNIIRFQDCLLFGSFISATDPVTVLAIFNDLSVEVDLYALVFGESVLNDAVAIVLAESVDKYGITNKGVFSFYELMMSIKLFLTVFIGALLIGCLVGIVTAVLTKFTYIRDHPLLETSLFCLMSYCSFLSSEAAGLSGIVASLFCGITQAHYTFNNLSDVSQRWTKEIFELLSFLSENFVFVYIGLSTITFRDQLWNPAFIFISLLAILVGRAVNIYILTALLNLGRNNRISWRYQNMLMFCGLRGAMAFALAIRNTSTPVRQIFFSTTLVIVMITVSVCGGLTKPMIKWLNIRMGKDAETLSQTPEPVNDITVAPNQLFDSVERHKKKAFIIRMFSQLDCKFIKPLLTHSPPVLTDSCSNCCLPLARLCTTNEQLARHSILCSSGDISHPNSQPNVLHDNHYNMTTSAPSSNNEINMNVNGDNLGYRPDSVMFNSNATSTTKPTVGLPSQFKKRDRDSDLELILAEDDENMGYIEADESGLYIANQSQFDKC